MSTSKPEFLRFTGHKAFTQRLVLSTLTGRSIHISKIRSSSPTNPGLAPHEISFLRLLEAVTNGSAIDVSYSGTTITYQPGLITGTVPGAGADTVGDVIEHTVPANCTRGITYFLVPLALLAPFSKAHMNVRFSGPGVITAATNGTGDVSVDTFRTAILPLYGLFGIPPARIELRVLSRSCAGPGGKGGGGVVELRFASQVRLPKTLHLNRRPGRIRRIRGVAYCTGVSASHNNRMIQAARSVLNALVSDLHVAAQYDPAPLVTIGENRPGQPAQKRKMGIGFGLSLVAESSAEGVLYAADEVAPAEGGVVPEDIGLRCAYQLLEIIAQGGCVSASASATILTLMAMGSEDVGRLRMGREVIGREETVGLARDLKTFGANAWGIRDVEDDDAGDLIVSVKGTGVGNVGRKVA
ncbi:RNA 3'-terminal phosphate cyclase/enolpyruvate transferase [Diplogelasinospora grovesii]|uniref:RNA 3'-terminal phosphate cyclase/enolpyruvate transferase n=1 Tax=Diplogelasinospora grovesii TaxID=303347 RepID=A0AAN6RZX3_9PEZI|nr:RNA 3'-terminal phosphate cyclase/enolpyruvate transferase [Diplogelasinospora grovesii]